MSRKRKNRRQKQDVKSARRGEGNAGASQGRLAEESCTSNGLPQGVSCKDASPVPQKLMINATGHNLLQDHLAFIRHLLDSLDRRRSAVDSRSAVVFAVTGAAIGFLLSQIGSRGPLQNNSPMRTSLLVTTLAILFAALLFSLSLIAPIPRTRKLRRHQASRASLSYFWRIAEGSEDEYRLLIHSQNADGMFFDGCRQVHSLAMILRARYARLRRTCRWLYSGLLLLALYILLTVSNLI